MKILMRCLIAVAAIYCVPANAQTSNWTGFYYGLNAGIGLDNSSKDVTTENGFTPGIFADPNINSSGLLGGGQFGFNYQVNQVVYGVESDFDFSNIRGKNTAVGPTGFSVEGKERLNWLSTMRGRIGVVANNVLFYGTGGLAFGRVKLSSNEFASGCGPNICSFGSTAETKTGWTAGVGAELPASLGWTVKFEYLYYDLGQIQNAGMDITHRGATDFTSVLDVHGNLIRVGLNYNFGTR